MVNKIQTFPTVICPQTLWESIQTEFYLWYLDYHVNGQMLTAAEVEDLLAMKEHYAKALEQHNGAHEEPGKYHETVLVNRFPG